MNALRSASSPRGLVVRYFFTLVVSIVVAGLALRTANAQAASAPTPASASARDTAFERCSKILKYGERRGIDEPTKVDAVHAMGLLGDERAVPLLIEHLENENNDHLRMEIVRSLGWLGSAEAVPALKKSLSDKYPFVRQQSAAALKKITGQEYDYDKTGLPSREKLKDMMERMEKAK